MPSFHIYSLLTDTHLVFIRRNYLHDLPSLDPELYRHLLFLKVKETCMMVSIFLLRKQLILFSVEDVLG